MQITYRIEWNFVLQIALFSLKLVGIVFVSSASIISSHKITESPMILAKYSTFS